MSAPGAVERVLRRAGACATWVRWGRDQDRNDRPPEWVFRHAMEPAGQAGDDPRQRFVWRSMLRAYVILPLLIRRDHPEWWAEYQRLRAEARATTTWPKMRALLRLTEEDR